MAIPDSSVSSLPSSPRLPNPRAQAAALRRLSARANARSSSSSSNSSSSASTSFQCFNQLGRRIVEHLSSSCKVHVDRGLSSDELERLEAFFGIAFPPDLRGILEAGLPLGSGFPDWRSGGAAWLRLWIDAPAMSLSPLTRSKAAPPLVPIFGRCYIPCSPLLASNPVLYFPASSAGATAKPFYCAANVGDFFRNDSFVAYTRSSSSSSLSAELYVPDPLPSFDARASSSSLESTRRFIARCESSLGQQEQQRKKIDEGDASGILSHGWLGAGRSHANARTSSSWSGGSRRSSADDEELPRLDTSVSSSGSESHHSRSLGIRRIEFWSDLVERGGDLQDDDDNDRGATPTASSTSVEEAVQEMAIKLRKAGWSEADIADIVAATPATSINREMLLRAEDRQAVLEGLAVQFDVLSTCLTDAGWSAHDVAEALCIDCGYHRGPRPRPSVRPEIAARMGVLAAFVAQG